MPARRTRRCSKRAAPPPSPQRLVLDHFTFIAIAVSVAATALATWYLTRRAVWGHYATASALDFQTKKTDLIDNIRTSMVDSADFLARLNNEYLRGKEDGRKEAGYC